MGDPRGFLQIARRKAAPREISERLRDFGELERLLPEPELRAQASRCMDCGIPYCHWACPLGNVIPDFNDRVYRGDPQAARETLEATNNFPEVTGRVCPAPCEASCTLSLEGAPVTIKDIERFVGDGGGPAAPLPAHPAASRRSKSVAIVGSGPAGLAAAQQLARKGYDVTVFERDERPGGLLRFGIPDFKLGKALVDRRIDQMRREGVMFATGTEVGVDPTADDLRWRFDAIVLAMGAHRARDLAVPGRNLGGVHFAMDFLAQQNRRQAGLLVGAEPILATGKRVVILGGGDTGADCLGTSLRQGAASVRQLELLPRPPLERREANPWPEWPVVLRTSSSHDEGGRREFALMTTALRGDEGRVAALSVVRVEPRDGRLVPAAGSEHEIPCDLVLLAMGFVGPETRVLDQLRLERDSRGNVRAEGGQTSVPGVFAAGDVVRGASLVVWAIAEGRRAAGAVDRYLARR